jgi:mitochondrial inner membrane protease ATP23
MGVDLQYAMRRPQTYPIYCAKLKYFAGPIVRFLKDQCAELGGDLNATNIRCRPCRSPQFAGFDPDYGIVLCSDTLATRSRKDLEDALAHEMVHAYDHLRFKVDRDNMKHQACTEVSVFWAQIDC